MKLPELSIRRPVLATVMTILLIVFGLMSYTRLSVREYPDIEVPIVSVRTVYPGAHAQLVETDVTTVLEDSLSGIEGLKTITSDSREEVSRITLEFHLSRDLDGAANDVRDRVARARRELPLTIQEPTVAKEDADAEDIIALALLSDRHSELEITDFAERQIKSRLATLPGVSTITLDAERRYAMRIWIDPRRLASRGLTVQDVEDALRNQNVSWPSGRIEGVQQEFDLQTKGELSTPEQFNHLIVAYRHGYPVRLHDIGKAELGAEDDRKILRVNYRPAIGLGVVKQSKANTLEVARAVRQEVEIIAGMLPAGMVLTIPFDSSRYIERSIQEVYRAMGLALALVVLVTFVFLANGRATLIPVAAIPASILGTFTLLYLCGFSLNVLTLLGLVLAIGLVVDDAIVMLENIHRRIEQGQPPMQAAIEGSREIGFAVVATTVSLVAVFVPIAFLTGMVGRLFAELALAVAGSVILSGFVALTLTPMMSSVLLKPDTRMSWVHRASGRVYASLADLYARTLLSALRMRAALLLVGASALLISVLLALRLPTELAPLEDTGWFVAHLIGPDGATIRYTDAYARQLEALLAGVPEIESVYTVVARGSRPTMVSRAASWVELNDWDARGRSQQEIVAALTNPVAALPGVKSFVANPPPLNQSSNKTPVQLVLGGTSYDEVERLGAAIVERAKGFPGLIHLDLDLALHKPQLAVQVQRHKAADLGISVATIGQTLETFLGGRPVTTFMRDGKAYRVIVKMSDENRARPGDLHALSLRGNGGELIPLSNLITVQETSAPHMLHHYDKMRAVTITGGVAEGFTLGEALAHLEGVARQLVPSGVRLSYAGESKEFKEAGAALYATFALALVVIYLVLAAQFESFVHPLTILLAVPPAITGALLALRLTGGTLNIYSQIGLVMLIGLVTKNAILIVEFANQLRHRGTDVTVAVVEAASLRLRPILMTTLATMLGAVPLALATGAGAAGRQQIGIVIIGGLLLSTLLTLFLVPTVYTLLAGRSSVTRNAAMLPTRLGLPHATTSLFERPPRQS